jgi:hypothetical protein
MFELLPKKYSYLYKVYNKRNRVSLNIFLDSKTTITLVILNVFKFSFEYINIINSLIF